MVCTQHIDVLLSIHMYMYNYNIMQTLFVENRMQDHHKSKVRSYHHTVYVYLWHAGSNTDVSSCLIGGNTDIWIVVGGVVVVAVALILTVIVHVLVALFRMRHTRKFTQKRY